jgi:hypothetical protein
MAAAPILRTMSQSRCYFVLITWRACIAWKAGAARSPRSSCSAPEQRTSSWSWTKNDAHGCASVAATKQLRPPQTATLSKRGSIDRTGPPEPPPDGNGKETGSIAAVTTVPERGHFGSSEFRSRIEFGRHYGAWGGTPTPFVGLEIASLRSNGFTDNARSGPGLFALNIQAQSSASAPGSSARATKARYAD